MHDIFGKQQSMYLNMKIILFTNAHVTQCTFCAAAIIILKSQHRKFGFTSPVAK
jgi:hypothetical protein